MPVYPFRSLAQSGILTDPSPYELDPTCWSNGVNVRFGAKKAMRSPAFWTAQDQLSFDPVFGCAYRPSTGFNSVMLPDVTGRIWQFRDLTLTEVTPTGISQTIVTNGGSGYSQSTPPAVTFSAAAGQTAATGTAVVNNSGQVTAITMTFPGVYPVNSTAPTVTIAPPGSGTQATATTTDPYVPESTAFPYTSTFLGDVLYINNPAGQPVYFGPTATNFIAMPSWSPQWSCASLRAYGDYLIALNVTKNGVAYPNMVKTSDLTLAGQPPDSWDQTNQTTVATENILERLDSPLVDGCCLRDSLVLYSTDQVWVMSQTGNQEVFAYDQLFSDGGLISQNCVVEVLGTHYVFGPYDIYQHDGVNKTPISTDRVRDYIYNSMNRSLSNYFFVMHLKSTKEILFAYVSGDANVTYNTTDGCNRGALYNYVENTWSFVDLPNVVAMDVAGLNSVTLWDSPSADASWENFGATWISSADTAHQDIFAVSRALPGSLSYARLLCYDYINKGTSTFSVISPECNPTAFIERTGIDLDNFTNDQPSNLGLYKVIKRVLPQVSIFGGEPVQILIGSQLTPSSPVNYAPEVTFDPTQQYKVDIRVGGRYLAIRISQPNLADFEVSGFDAEIVNAGAR